MDTLHTQDMDLPYFEEDPIVFVEVIVYLGSPGIKNRKQCERNISR